jgi:hypothetical protein
MADTLDLLRVAAAGIADTGPGRPADGRAGRAPAEPAAPSFPRHAGEGDIDQAGAAAPGNASTPAWIRREPEKAPMER